MSDIAKAALASKEENPNNTPDVINSTIKVFVRWDKNDDARLSISELVTHLTERDPTSWEIMKRRLTTKESWKTVMNWVKIANPPLLVDTKSFIEALRNPKKQMGGINTINLIEAALNEETTTV
jgi:hypothetical protein